MKVRQGDEVLYVAEGAAQPGAPAATSTVLERLKGAEMLGWRYEAPFDDLAGPGRGRAASHRVIPWEEVGAEEGTGIVHIAPGCGEEDFELGQEHGLAGHRRPWTRTGVFLDGFGWLSGRYAARGGRGDRSAT